MIHEQAVSRAPSVTLQAVGHKRRITIDAIGVPALLLFVARETSDQPPTVVNAVRERYPTADQLLIANVADGRPFPKLIRKIAEQIMKSSYNDAVKNLQPGRAPEDYVLILPDWDGALLGPLGIDDVTKRIAVAVTSRSGDLVGVYQGDDPATAALDMLALAGV